MPVLRPFLSFLLIVVAGPLALAQCTPAHLTAEQDHQRMMDLLHIQSLRPGPSGTMGAPNATNYDEAKAGPFSRVPDALVLNNGKPVTSAKMWWRQRRPQIVSLFDEDVLGRAPQHLPAVHWEVVSTTHEMNGDMPVITKKLAGHVDNSGCPAIKVDIQVTLSTPEKADHPVPVIMELDLLPEVMAMFAKRFPNMPKPTGPT
ncbi:MAG: acetylxylan esterase, partial [Acidobacteriaceae bacterium]